MLTARSIVWPRSHPLRNILRRQGSPSPRPRLPCEANRVAGKPAHQSLHWCYCSVPPSPHRHPILLPCLKLNSWRLTNALLTDTGLAPTRISGHEVVLSHCLQTHRALPCCFSPPASCFHVPVTPLSQARCRACHQKLARKERVQPFAPCCAIITQPVPELFQVFSLASE